MLRIAIQVKELISSNVTSVIDAASNPAKMLHRLQREIEEAIIALEGERTLARQRKTRLEAQQTQTQLREADWSDKARIAMDHDREDLARQALLAREDCRGALARIAEDIAASESELAQLDEAIAALEAKREETREQTRRQTAADAAGATPGAAHTAASRAEAHLGRISELEKRTEFATEDFAEKRAHASVDQEIAAMRRASAIDAELAAMKGTAATAEPSPPASSKRTSSKERA